MAKPRQGKHDEIMLIPFLDILCSLIGVLILVIVVLCAVQMQRVKGRTKEDVQTAQRYQTLQLQIKAEAKAAADLRQQLAELARRQQERDAKQAELDAKQQKLAELRKRLTLSTTAASTNKQASAALQKQIEDLLAQLAAIVKTMPPLQIEIDKLKKLLTERQKKPDDKPAVMVVRASGSGAKRGQRLFFVEAAGAGIVIHQDKGELVRVATGSVGVDKEYNAFLTTVKNAGNAALIFLIRKDGWGTYNRAAGWAEQGFNLTTSKLPIPGDGAVDLSVFGKP